MTHIINCRTMGRVPSHLTESAVHGTVAARAGVREISDAAAVTIASWWASPGRDGAALAALATTGRADLDALLADISRARQSVPPTGRHARALDALSTWALNHPSVRPTVVVNGSGGVTFTARVVDHRRNRDGRPNGITLVEVVDPGNSRWRAGRLVDVGTRTLTYPPACPDCGDRRRSVRGCAPADHEHPWHNSRPCTSGTWCDGCGRRLV